MICAYATGLGFALRGYLALAGSPLLRWRPVRVLPHFVDSALLASAVGMLYQWSLSPLATPWLQAKLTALLLYIACGLLMLRWGTSAPRRWVGFLGGLLVYAYIVGVAHGKSPGSWLAVVA